MRQHTSISLLMLTSNGHPYHHLLTYHDLLTQICMQLTVTFCPTPGQGSGLSEQANFTAHLLISLSVKTPTVHVNMLALSHKCPLASHFIFSALSLFHLHSCCLGSQAVKQHQQMAHMDAFSRRFQNLPLRCLHGVLVGIEPAMPSEKMTRSHSVYSRSK